MKRKFSTFWKSSKQVRKQRKYNYNAPLHRRSKFMNAHLSKELMKKYQKRSTQLRKGDKVKIMRGQFKSKIGKVERVDIKKQLIIITGIEIVKKDGSKTFYRIHPSNVQITELYMDDKKRKKKLGVK